RPAGPPNAGRASSGSPVPPVLAPAVARCAVAPWHWGVAGGPPHSQQGSWPARTAPGRGTTRRRSTRAALTAAAATQPHPVGAACKPGALPAELPPREASKIANGELTHRRTAVNR